MPPQAAPAPVPCSLLCSYYSPAQDHGFKKTAAMARYFRGSVESVGVVSDVSSKVCVPAAVDTCTVLDAAALAHFGVLDGVPRQLGVAGVGFVDAHGAVVRQDEDAAHDDRYEPRMGTHHNIRVIGVHFVNKIYILFKNNFIINFYIT